MEDLVLCSDCSAATPLGVFLSTAQFEKRTLTCLGLDWRTSFHSALFPPLPSWFGSRCPPEELEPRAWLPSPQEPSQASLCYFAGLWDCEAQWFGPWALEPGRIQLPSEELYKMESFRGQRKKLLEKENKGLFQARSPFLVGERNRRGLYCAVTSLVLILDQEISD